MYFPQPDIVFYRYVLITIQNHEISAPDLCSLQSNIYLQLQRASHTECSVVLVRLDILSYSSIYRPGLFSVKSGAILKRKSMRKRSQKRLFKVRSHPLADTDEESVSTPLRPLFNHSSSDLISEGIIPGVSSIVDRWINILPYGYPIPTVNRNEVLSHTQNLLESNRIYSRGIISFSSCIYTLISYRSIWFMVIRSSESRSFIHNGKGSSGKDLPQ